MAVNIGELFAELGLDTRKFDTSIRGVDQKVTNTGRVFGKGGVETEKFSAKLTRLGKVGFAAVAIGAAAATAALGVLLVKATAAASKAEETDNLFTVSFGNMAAAAEEWAQRTSAAVGVNDTTFKEFSGTIFNFVTSAGVAREAAFSMAQGVTQLTADFSSFFNIPFDQAFTKIQSGLAGEVEGLRRLGIDVSIARIEQTEFAKSILDSGRALTEQEKIQARYIAILQQSNNAQGDLIRTQDSWANRTRTLSEVWVDFLETLGKSITESAAVSNALGIMITAVTTLSAVVAENRQAMGEWINFGFFLLLETTAQTISVLGNLIKAFGFTAKAVTFTQSVFIGFIETLIRAATFIPGLIPGLSNLRARGEQGAQPGSLDI